MVQEVAYGSSPTPRTLRIQPGFTGDIADNDTVSFADVT